MVHNVQCAYVQFVRDCAYKCVYSKPYYVSDTYSLFAMCLIDKNHLDATCFDKQIRLQRSICAKAITLSWYYNIQMLIGVTLQSISKEKQQKTNKRPPSSFSGCIISKSLI